MKILLVDDEPIVTKTFKKAVDWSKAGVSEVYCALSGEDALNILKKNEISFLVTDIKMPRMDGIELTEKALEINPSLKVIVLSAFDDYKYVRKAFLKGAIDFFIKVDTEPKDLLEAICRNFQAKSHLEKEKNSILKGYLLKKIIQNDKLHLGELSIDLYQLKESKSIFENQKLLITVDLKGREKEKVTDYINISDFIRNEFRNYSLNYFAEITLDTYVILISEKTWDKPNEIEVEIKNKIRTIQKQIEDSYKVNANFYVSNPFRNIMLCKNLFERSQIIIEKEFFQKEKKNIVYGFNSDDKCEKIKSLVNIDELLKKLWVFDLEGVKIKSEEINKSIIKSGIKDKRIFFDIYLEVFYHCNFNLRKHYSANEYQIYNISKIIDEMYQIDSLSKFMKWFYDKIKEYLFMVKSQEKGRLDEDVFKAKMLLKKHFKENINLNYISKKILINPSYLSKKFSSQMGVSISNYLMNLKVEEAKIQLETTNKKIYDIAENLGFQSAEYFSRKFKEYTEMSPKKYRKKLQK